MILSAVVAFVATVGMTVQAYWHKLVSLLRRAPRGTKESGRTEDESLEG